MWKVEDIAQIYQDLQKEICRSLELADGKAIFKEDRWERNIGFGLTSVICKGNNIEKGGVNFSFVEGDFTPQMEVLLGEKANRYSVTGISSIMHPANPFVPIIHMNVRFFSLDNGAQWFGGGIDLTPHYIDVLEAKKFHNHSRFKPWADDYFFIPHRHETRGIGGIFFDRLKPGDNIGFEQLLDFTTDLCRAYPLIYTDIINRKKVKQFTSSQKEWQQLRRGRYVEFNLAYDRGTRFGFESNGNAESILISLPATAGWEYNHEVKPGSDEHNTLQLLKKGIDWLNI
jgi:coproporphyrinogen III oxidase